MTTRSLISTPGRIGLVGLAVLALGAGSALGASPADRNRDGLPDRWEKANGLPLSVKQAKKDQDHDGLTNLGEFQAKTSPRKADSDRDGVSDANEDRDHDGLSNNQEETLGTGISDADSDNDGRRDGAEHPGSVVSFDAASGLLVVAAMDGSTQTVHISPATTIRRDEKHATSAEIVTGGAIEEMTLSPDGAEALVIVLSDEASDGEDLELDSGGTVVSFDVASGRLVIQPPTGAELALVATASTSFEEGDATGLVPGVQVKSVKFEVTTGGMLATEIELPEADER